MEHKKKTRKTFKIKLLIVLIFIVIIAIFAIITINNFIKNKNELNGVFIYNEKVKYEFNGIRKGAMYDGDTKYSYTYKIKENNLIIDFKDDAVYDATYTYKLDEDTLTLIGGEGTTGGEYILKRNEEVSSDKNK